MTPGLMKTADCHGQVRRAEERGKQLMRAERDAARREAEELGKQLQEAAKAFEEVCFKHDEQSAQIAALREAAEGVLDETSFAHKPATGEPLIHIRNPLGPAHRNLRAVLADTAPKDSMLKTLRERSVLTSRLIQALAPLSAARQVEIVASFINLDHLHEIVLFQERRS